MSAFSPCAPCVGGSEESDAAPHQRSDGTWRLSSLFSVYHVAERVGRMPIDVGIREWVAEMAGWQWLRLVAAI